MMRAARRRSSSPIGAGVDRPDSRMTTTAAACAAIILAVTTAGARAQAQESEVQLVTVVGCLRQDEGSLPWIIEKATEGTPATTPYTSEEELNTSAGQALGTLEYRLLGVAEFGVESHVGHKVQAKGLRVMYEGEQRLNLTSFQHIAPDCQG